MLRLTYETLGVNLIGMLQVCDGCEISKAKSCAVINNTYTRASNPGEIIFVDTTGAFPESLTGCCYFIGVVDDYNCYSRSLSTKMKSQLPKRMEEFFEK